MEPKAKSWQEPGPGAVLRQAREERRLSIDAVAHELRLSPRLITALEEDAYDRLPGPTYVRGYLRNYAQFLKVPAQRLIDTYNNRPEATQRTDMTAPAPVRQATSSDAMVRLGTVLVAAVVFGLAALWWSGHDGSVPRLRPAPPLPAAESTDNASPAEPPAPAPETSPGTFAETATEPSAPQPTPAERPAPEPANVAEVNNAAIAAAPPIDPSAPRSRLILYMHEDSWADVRDAQQRRLLYETIPAGRVVTVEGVAPISVFLGNVGGVTVEFDGQQYDALRHRRGEVARFTLGAPRG